MVAHWRLVSNRKEHRHEYHYPIHMRVHCLPRRRLRLRLPENCRASARLRAAMPVRSWMRLRAAMPVQSWKRPCKELIHEPTPWDRTLPLGRPCGIFHHSRFCEKIPISRSNRHASEARSHTLIHWTRAPVACLPPPSGLNLSLDRPTTHDKYHVAVHSLTDPIAVNKVHA